MTDGKNKFADVVANKDVAPPVSKPGSGKLPEKDTIYFRGERGQEMLEHINNICRDHHLTKQKFYWYALNLALKDYGHAPIAEPEDGRKKS